jgi:RNA 2',3'-cyclic 3'-phosphodiesterase
MRLFFAVEIPEEARATLKRGMGELKRDLPPARWVRAEGMHVTLKFVGELEASAVATLVSEVGTALAGCHPVEVELGGGGFFPSAQRPRVAWIGGSAVGLERIAAALDEAAAAVGVERERRPFSLHLTLARMERPWGAPATETFVVRTGKWQFAPFAASEVVLFESDLQPSGAVYTALRRWPLGGER